MGRIMYWTIFNLDKLSQYRTQLMGCAAIMIIICHAEASSVLIPPKIGHVLAYGNYGVDVFLFLSGIGCFYSLDKTSNLFTKGLFPTFGISSIVW